MKEIERAWEMRVAAKYRGESLLLSRGEQDMLVNSILYNEMREKKEKEEELADLSEELSKMMDHYSSLKDDYKEMKKECRELSAENNSLKSDVMKLKEDNKALRESRHTRTVVVKDVSEKEKNQDLLISNLKNELREKNRKIGELEQFSDFLRNEVEKRNIFLNQQKEKCEHCEKRDLCLKRVLLVGGIAKLKDEYEKAALDLNGQFKFHEGHKSKSRELKDLIKWADTVIIPVEINSHFACLEAKKLCKKWNKKYQVINSASVSSVKRTLEDIAC